MLKPTDIDSVKGDLNRYALVIAVAKRARQIADEAEEQNVILTEKPVSLSVNDFESGKYKVTLIER
jgi:DNA-directed RNA polymerase subunit omega